MTTENPGPRTASTLAEVVPLRAEDAGTETAFDQATGPAYLDTSGTGDARRHPVIPEHLRRDRIRQTAAEALGLHWYKARYHGFRSPAYAVKTLWYAVRGLFRLAGQLVAWANWADGWVLESLAVAAGRSGHHDAMNAHMQGRKTRATRWQIVGVSAVAAVAVLLAMVRWLPWWGWLARRRGRGGGADAARRPGGPADHPRRDRADRLPAAHPRGDHPRAGVAGHRRDQRGDQGRPGHRVRLRRAPRRRRLGRRAGPAARRDRLATSSSAARRWRPGCAARTRRPGPRRCRTSTPGGCTCGSDGTTCPRPSRSPTRCSRPGPPTCSARCRSRPTRAARASARRCSKPTG